MENLINETDQQPDSNSETGKLVKMGNTNEQVNKELKAKFTLEEIRDLFSSSQHPILLRLSAWSGFLTEGQDVHLWFDGIAQKLSEVTPDKYGEVLLVLQDQGMVPPADAIYNFEAARPSLFRQNLTVHVEGITFGVNEMTPLSHPLLWYQHVNDPILRSCFQEWNKLLANISQHKIPFKLCFTEVEPPVPPIEQTTSSQTEMNN